MKKAMGRGKNRIHCIAGANREGGEDGHDQQSDTGDDSRLTAEEQGLTESEDHRYADRDGVDPKAGQGSAVRTDAPFVLALRRAIPARAAGVARAARAARALLVAAAGSAIT